MLIYKAGARAAWRFLEFFTVKIRSRNSRAGGAFLRCCEGPGIGELGRVQPAHVAAYIELLQNMRSAPTVKQHLACIRMLFDWLVVGQVMPTNPAHSVRGGAPFRDEGFNACVRRAYRSRAAHGRAFERKDHRALRPAQR